MATLTARKTSRKLEIGSPEWTRKRLLILLRSYGYAVTGDRLHFAETYKRLTHGELKTPPIPVTHVINPLDAAKLVEQVEDSHFAFDLMSIIHGFRRK
jgi:hypothetical protein